MTESGHLLISCPDRPGIVARVSTLLFDCGANITESAQHSTDPFGGRFFMRLAFTVATSEMGRVAQSLQMVATELQALTHLHWSSQRKRMAIFFSREAHCVLELLWRHRAGELAVDIPVVLSNHADHGQTIRDLGYPFLHVPVAKDNKLAAEIEQLGLLQDIDFLVLARYMQILTPEFLASFARPIVNIHHSFLPAFVGARPYERAYARGVKLIGATAHYVTEDLDEGPIVEQGVERVGHGHTVEDLKALGRQIERAVLARAVRWHVENRVVIHDNKTIVFE
ncbi:MAG: formyltetrahydrofolate deformylase [Firmicutes bacterium]|nr:formyltetrahydrofolate deformylase [Bacillota bacterium]